MEASGDAPLPSIPQELQDAYDSLGELSCVKKGDAGLIRIIVVGVQSVGKSTCLEAIANGAIKLPTGSLGDPVTRTPIMIQLRCRPGPTRCFYKVGDHELEVRDDVRGASSSDIYKRLLGGNGSAGIVMDREDIVLVAHGKNLPNLTLIDLPGIPMDDHPDFLSVRAKLDEYVTSPNNITVVVENARSESGRSALWEKLAGKRGVSVYNCFNNDCTPLLPKKVEEDNKLSMKAHVVKLRNEEETKRSRPQSEIDAEAVEEVLQFCKTAVAEEMPVTESQESAFRNAFGIQPLVTNLAALYKAQLVKSEYLQLLTHQVKQQKDKDLIELEGLEKVWSPEEANAEFDSWCSRLVLMYKDLLAVQHQVYKGTATADREKQERRRHIVNKVETLAEVFALNVRSDIDEYLTTKASLKANLEKAVELNMGLGLPQHFSQHIAFHNVFKEWVPSLEKHVRQLVEDVGDEVILALHHLVWHEEANDVDIVVPERFQGAGNLMKQGIRAFVAECKKQAIEDALSLVHRQTEYGAWSSRYDDAASNLSSGGLSHIKDMGLKNFLKKGTLRLTQAGLNRALAIAGATDSISPGALDKAASIITETLSKVVQGTKNEDTLDNMLQSLGVHQATTKEQQDAFGANSPASSSVPFFYGGLQGRNGEHPGGLQGRNGEHPVGLQGRNREHPGGVQGRNREHPPPQNLEPVYETGTRQSPAVTDGAEKHKFLVADGERLKKFPGFTDMGKKLEESCRLYADFASEGLLDNVIRGVRMLVMRAPIQRPPPKWNQPNVGVATPDTKAFFNCIKAAKETEGAAFMRHFNDPLAAVREKHLRGQVNIAEKWIKCYQQFHSGT